MKIALYARCSTNDQNPETQLLALRQYASSRQCEIVEEYIDKGISGSKNQRPALNKLMQDAKNYKFEAVLCWRFDRFARSVKHLLEALEEFRYRNIQFISLTENIDTGSPLGAAMFTIIGAMAQLEKDIIVERVKAGISRAKSEGKRIGKKKMDVDLDQIKKFRRDGLSIRKIADNLKVSKSLIETRLKELSL